MNRTRKIAETVAALRSGLVVDDCAPVLQRGRWSIAITVGAMTLAAIVLIAWGQLPPWLAGGILGGLGGAVLTTQQQTLIVASTSDGQLLCSSSRWQVKALEILEEAPHFDAEILQERFLQDRIRIGERTVVVPRIQRDRVRSILGL